MTSRHLLIDARANCNEVGTSGPTVASLFNLRFLAVFLFRLAQVIGRRSGVGADLIKQVNQLLTGADVSWRADIGPGLVLHHPVGVVIGAGVVAGSDLVIQQGVTVGGDGSDKFDRDAFPTIGNGVRLGSGSKVLGHVHIGTGSVVGANAVVISDIADFSVAVGVPARVVKLVSDRAS